RFSKRNYMEIYEILIVTGRVCLELSLRYFLSVAARHWNPVPVVMKIYSVGETRPDWEKFPRRLIVLRLQNDEKGTVLVHHSPFFGPGRPAHISAAGRVILIKII